jgi:hypothetical protein
MLSRNSISDLVPYIASAAVAAFVLGYCSQPFAAAAGRIGARTETAQPVNIVDRSHKGDRLTAPDQTVRPDLPRSSKLTPAIPDGCDPAFGPLLTTEQGNFAGRCVV